MSAEEFVLIPRHMFIQEQGEVLQILKNPEIQNPAKFGSERLCYELAFRRGAYKPHENSKIRG